jgi:hypothetical protein
MDTGAYAHFTGPVFYEVAAGEFSSVCEGYSGSRTPPTVIQDIVPGKGATFTSDMSIIREKPTAAISSFIGGKIGILYDRRRASDASYAATAAAG